METRRSREIKAQSSARLQPITLPLAVAGLQPYRQALLSYIGQACDHPVAPALKALLTRVFPRPVTPGLTRVTACNTGKGSRGAARTGKKRKVTWRISKPDIFQLQNRSLRSPNPRRSRNKTAQECAAPSPPALRLREGFMYANICQTSRHEDLLNGAYQDHPCRQPAARGRTYPAAARAGQGRTL